MKSVFLSSCLVVCSCLLNASITDSITYTNDMDSKSGKVLCQLLTDYAEFDRCVTDNFRLTNVNYLLEYVHPKFKTQISNELQNCSELLKKFCSGRLICHFQPHNGFDEDVTSAINAYTKDKQEGIFPVTLYSTRILSSVPVLDSIIFITLYQAGVGPKIVGNVYDGRSVTRKQIDSIIAVLNSQSNGMKYQCNTTSHLYPSDNIEVWRIAEDLERILSNQVPVENLDKYLFGCTVETKRQMLKIRDFKSSWHIIPYRQNDGMNMYEEDEMHSYFLNMYSSDGFDFGFIILKLINSKWVICGAPNIPFAEIGSIKRLFSEED